MSVKGKTGLEMLQGALDALRRIDKLRSEPRFEFQHEWMAETLSSLKTQVSFSGEQSACQRPLGGGRSTRSHVGQRRSDDVFPERTRYMFGQARLLRRQIWSRSAIHPRPRLA